MSKKLRPWRVLESKEVFGSGIFRLKVERLELPEGRVMPRYYVMDFPDWVHALAVTADQQMVMLRQYRHAGKDSFWEIPGGSMNWSAQEGATESPLEAAQRELKEETGYTSQKWLSVAQHHPNPALQSNRMHVFLALDCQLTDSPQLDAFEELQVELHPVKEVYKALDRGEIAHSLMAASLAAARSHLSSILGK